MSKTVRIVVIIGVILIAVAAMTMHNQRSRNVAALAAYKAVLRAQGEKLTAAELGYPRPPETSSNLNLLIASVGQLATGQFQPGGLEFMRFVSPGKAEVAWDQPELQSIWRSINGPNTPSWEMFGAQFDNFATAMQELRNAVQGPPAYFINDPTNFTNPPKGPFVQLRNAAHWLMGDTVAALHAGQLDRALADVHALTQLAQFHREDPTLVSQMIRAAMAGVGLAATWEALQAKGWSDEQLATLQQDWQAVDLAGVFEIGITGERVVLEACFDHMRSLSPRQRAAFFRGGIAGPASAEDFFDELVLLPLWATNSEADEMFYLRHLQTSLDAVRQLQRGTAWPVVSQQLKTNMDEMQVALSNPVAKYRYLISARALPNYARAGSVYVRHETQRRLTITAIALERFRLRAGKYPAELDALVPQFLSAVPIDLMSAKPLRYRLNAEGTFTLYSVGEDGRDDGGDPTSGSGTNKFGLWEGKDAVWPTAVK